MLFSYKISFSHSFVKHKKILETHIISSSSNGNSHIISSSSKHVGETLSNIVMSVMMLTWLSISLDRAPTPPSGPNPCPYISGSGHCGDCHNATNPHHLGFLAVVMWPIFLSFVFMFVPKKKKKKKSYIWSCQQWSLASHLCS